jgi:signal transduction histidine kinase/FixJ family two-component response regulator
MKTKFSGLFKKLVLPFFILGLTVIIILKSIENKSINNLVDRNIDFLSMQEKRNKLHQLQGDIASFDGMLRELVKTGNNDLVNTMSTKIESTRKEIKAYELSTEGETSFSETNHLITLLADKAAMQQEALESYAKKDISGAEKIISSSKYRGLQDKITEASVALMDSQRVSSLQMADLVRSNGKEAHMLSIILVIAASILGLFVCIHMLIKKKQSENAEQKATTAVKIKENFLANMSHEIRTPLNAILGFTNILSRTNLDQEQLEHLQIIHSSGDNLLSIVNDILDLSKIEAGMMRIEEAPFRVSDVMATVEGMLSQKANEKNIKLIVKVDEDVPKTLSGDAVRLTQIMVNLVSNAIKFTQEGGVYVKVTPFKSDGETIVLEFLVRDTGIGIPKEKQKFIFERFEQAEAETTRRFGGTGLGLSIVKHLIELQKGKITLNSQENVGSMFLVELPYKITNESALSYTVKNNNQKFQLMNNNVNILVAEDNTMNQHLIKHLLKNWGFKFDLVFNGAQAVEALSNQNYDMVLMDIQMPEMDGHLATNEIRKKLKSDVPVIAMTAHAMVGEREKCIKSGMNDYISKPLNEDSLYAMIIKYSKNSGNTPAAGNEQSNIQENKTSKVLNLEFIDKFSKDDTDFKKEIIKEFVNRVPDNLTTMEKAIGEKNYSAIYRIAHDMKTTVHFMGLTALIGHLLQKIEELASSNQAIVSIQQMFTDIKLVCMQAVQEAGHLAV